MRISKKIFFGWYVVAGGFLLMAILHSMMQTCFSLFVVPVTTDMGITRSAFGICNTVVMVVTMLLSPYMGKWLAQKRTTLIFTTCIVGLGLSYASYSLAHAAWHLYVSAFLVGVFSCGAVALPLSIIITNWFKKARGTAISIALAGSGIGGAIISPILTMVIQNMGWRPAFVIFGIVMIVVEVPVALFLMRPRPEDMNLQPYGADENAPQDVEHKDDDGVPLSALKKYPFFWIYWVGMFVMGLVGFAMRLWDFPAAAMLIGFVLGPQFEYRLGQVFLFKGELSWLEYFSQNPVGTGLLVITAFILLSPIYSALRRKGGDAATPDAASSEE